MIGEVNSRRNRKTKTKVINKAKELTSRRVRKTKSSQDRERREEKLAEE